MKTLFSSGSAITATILCGLVCSSSSCRKPQAIVQEAAKPVVSIAPELLTNGISSLPSAVYRSQANSPVHWQPWSKETFARARAANRLIFGVIAMPQQPAFQSVLAAFDADAALVSTINDNYVPVLIDGDASREIGLLTADFCSEIKHAAQLPLFIWITPDGNPVAWIPASGERPEKANELFYQSHSMVGRMWLDDYSYVVKNSATDNGNRRARLAARKNAKVMSEQPAEDTLRAVRQLISFYDPDSRSFDEAGGLFPSGALDLLSTAAIHSGVSEELRKRSLETTQALLDDLLPSAMFDPLEGGVFTARRSNTWALPIFYRECNGQARAAVALLNAYRATKDARALEKGLDVINFAEKNFMTTDGLFSVGMTKKPETSAWLWSVEEIEKELGPAEAAWWIKATGMKGLGNLPSEADPRREYFRSNTLGLSQSLTQIAAGLGQSVDDFKPRFEAARKKLLKARNLRVGEMSRDGVSQAAVTFRMVSAYAAAFGVTGDPVYRDKASALLTKAKAAFSNGPRLRMFAEDAPKAIGEGRAFLYGLALQAGMDVAAVTSDEQWLVWSEDLATTAAELFTDSEFLKECPDDAKIIDLPVTDLVMLFDDSTAGLISFAEYRLAERGRPLVKSFSDLATPLPVYAVDRPILHTDLLQATLARQFKITVIPGANLSPEMKLALERLPMRMIQRRPAKPADEVPDGSVKVIFAGGSSRIISLPAVFDEPLLPSPEKL